MVLVVESDWSGCDGDTVVKLSNGTFWRQDEYLYEYHYSYRPAARIDRQMMHVDGMSRGVRVRQIYPVETQVSGEWKGWDGKTEVELVNGQVWQQIQYHYEYRYSYRPHVILDGDMMQVEGMNRSIKVRRVR